jgi:hypothetical protein
MREYHDVLQIQHPEASALCDAGTDSVAVALPGQTGRRSGYAVGSIRQGQSAAGAAGKPATSGSRRWNRNGNGNESRRLSMDVEHGYLTTFIQ